MSDVPMGDGWWQASDAKWYAPESHPDYVAPAATPPTFTPPTFTPPSFTPPTSPPPGAAQPQQPAWGSPEYQAAAAAGPGNAGPFGAGAAPAATTGTTTIRRGPSRGLFWTVCLVGLVLIGVATGFAVKYHSDFTDAQHALDKVLETPTTTTSPAASGSGTSSGGVGNTGAAARRMVCRTEQAAIKTALAATRASSADGTYPPTLADLAGPNGFLTEAPDPAEWSYTTDGSTYTLTGIGICAGL